MKQQFITHTGQSRLLLIFTGWGMDPQPLSGLHRDGYDIAVVWDYTTDRFDTSPYAGYREIAVMAWSMGVWGASRVIPDSSLPVTLTIAINGTLSPVSDTLGIPSDIFRMTLDGLDEASLLKFYRRTAGGAAAYKSFARTLPQRSIDGLRAELSRIGQCGPAPAGMRWDKAVISSRDAIFPPENQRRQWTGICGIIDTDGPHLPDWEAIIDRFLIDKSLVESRFRGSLTTYDHEAAVQQRIASHLWQLWQKHINRDAMPDSIIEIGSGTGSFTRLYTQRLHPSSLCLWDLVHDTSDTSTPGQKICCDAEIAIMEQASASTDAIVSASAIQWFNSIGNFFRQSLRVLKPGGLLVVSTFGSRTFNELARAGASSLPYTDILSIRDMIPEGFEILELHDGLITKVFDSPIDVLRHIKATGVNAIHRQANASMTRSVIARYPTGDDGRASLTYNPIYMILKKS